MLAPESMIDENLDLWEDGIDFSVWLLREEEDYELFSKG